MQNRLKKFVESGQLGIFANGYWGSPAYKLPPEANLMAVTHYLEALDFQKEIVKIQTIFGGKNPHPNWLVGGVPCSLNLDDAGAVGAINMERLNLVGDIIDRTIDFIDQVYIPDLLAIAVVLQGLGARAAACRQEHDVLRRVSGHRQRLLERRACCCRGRRSSTATCTKVHEVDLQGTRTQIQEFVTHSWYKYARREQGAASVRRRHRAELLLGKARPRARAPTIENLDESAKYSWVKAPRWKGNAMEVGPLVAHGVGLCAAGSNRTSRSTIDDVLKKLDVPGHGAVLHARPHRRARPRGVSGPTHKMQQFYDKLMANLKAGDNATANVEKWEPSTWPTEAKGVGFSEAPRGALAHWIKIKDTKIDNYQCVVPTTWNASPRDAKGQIGAYEAALLNTPMAKPDATARDPAHHPQLRPVPRLRDARDVARGQELVSVQGALIR